MNRLLLLWGLSWGLLSSCTEQAGTKSEDALVEGRALTASDYLSVRILPEKAEVPAGRRLPFSVIGILPYGHDSDLTEKGSFESSDPDIFDFPKDQSPGTGVAMRAGKVTISYTYGSLEISTELTISAKIMDQMHLSQDSVLVGIEKVGAIYEERRIQLQATGFFSDGTSEDLSSQVKWTLGDENTVSAIADQPGYFLTKAPGKTQVTVSIGDKSQIVPIEVIVGTTDLKTLSLTPSPLLLPLQTIRDIEVTAHYSDGTTSIITDAADYMVTPPSIANLQSNGGSGLQIASQVLGNGVLSVSYKDVSVDFPLAAIDAEASTLRLVSTQSFALAKGEAESLQVWLDSSDGTQENVTTRATWKVANTSILSAVAGTKGRYTALRTGTSTVTATLGSLSVTQTMTVTAARVVSLALTTAESGVMGLYQTRDYIATATYTDATTKVVTADVTWSSTAGTGLGHFDATVKNRFQGTTTGTVTINASLNTVVAHSNLTIGGVVATNLTLQSSWTTLSLATGAKQLTAVVNYSDGRSEDMTNDVTWNYVIVGSGLNFAGYVSDTAGTKGSSVPVATGFYKATASYLNMTAEKSIQVTP